MDISKRIAFSGAPGAGKTAVADELRGLGYAVVAESARQYISDRKARGLSPRPSPTEFAQALIENDIDRYESVQDNESHTFFDRTVLDSLCMLELQGGLSIEGRTEFLSRYRYNSSAFLFPPWREIYCMDSERDQSYEESIAVFELLKSWYVNCGYKTLIVPPATVAERCAYILQSLGIPN